MAELRLPDAALVADEIFDAGLDAVLGEPALEGTRQKLTARELRALVAIITEATATIAATLLLKAAIGERKDGTDRTS